MSSLMANFDIAQNALQTSIDSSGSAMKEHDKWSQSFEARLLKLKATWQSLSQSFMSSDFLKVVIDGVIALVDVLDELISTLGTLPTLIGIFGAFKSITAIVSTAKTMNMVGGYKSIASVLSLLSAAFPKTTSLITKFTSALKQMFDGGVIKGVKSLGTSLIGLVMKHPYIAAATVAIGALTTVIMHQKKEAEDLAKKVDDVTSKYKEQHGTLIKMKGDYDSSNENSMISKYGELSKGVSSLGENVSLTTSEYAEYQSIVDSIAGQFPELVTGYNSQGNAILSCAGNVDALTEAYKNLIIEQNKAVLDSGDDIFKDFKNDTSKFEQYDRSTGQLIHSLSEYYNGIESLVESNDFESTIKNLSQTDIINISKILEENGFKRNTLGSGEKGWETQREFVLRAIKEDSSTVKKALNDSLDDINAYTNELSTIVDAYFSNAFLGDYSHFSDRIQNMIVQVASNFDATFYDQFNGDSNKLTGYLESMLNAFDSLSELDTKNLEAAFDLKTKFNGGDISYGEYIKNIREANDLIDGINVDEEIKSQIKLVLNSEDVTKEYDTLINRLTSEEIGLNHKSAKSLLDGLSSEEFSVLVSIIPDLDDGATIDKIQAIIDEKLATEFKFDIEVQTTGIESLNTALEESRSAIGLTSESIEALTSRYKDLDSFNAAALFEKTANGIHLNNEELSRLEELYINTNKLNIDSTLNTLITKYKDLTEEIKNCADGQEKESLQLQADAYKKKIDEVSTLASQYDGLTSAFSKWQNALEGAEEGDNYDSLYENLKSIKELRKKGLVGTDKFKTAVQLMSNEDLSTASIDEIVSAYEKGYPKMQRYFTKGQQGCKNFLKDVSKLNSEWAHMNKDGSWEIDFNAEEVADKLGVSVDFVLQIAKKLKDYGFEVNLEDSSVDNLQTRIEQTEAKLKELGQSPVDINVDIEANSGNIGTIEAEIEKAKNKISEINNSSVEPNVKTAQLEDAQAKLEVLIDKKIEASQPAFMSLNTSQVNASLVEALEKVKSYQEAINEVNKLSELKEAGITVDDSQIKQAKEKVDECAKAIQGLDGDVKVAIGLEKDGSIDSIKKAFEEGKVKIDADTDPAVTKVKQLSKDIEKIEDKDITINVTIEGLDDVKELKDEIGEINKNIDLSTKISGNIESLTEYVEGAKELSGLDNTIASYVTANLNGNLGENKGNIESLKEFADGAKALEGVKSSNVSVGANLESNLAFNGSLDKLEQFADGAKALDNVDSTDVFVKANLDGNLGLNGSLDKLESFSKGAKSLEDVSSVDVYVKANLDANLGINGSLDKLEAFAEGAKALRNVDNVDVAVKANLDGNLGFNGSLDKLEQFANGAKSLNGVENVDVSVKANLDANLGLNGSLDELPKFTDGAKELDGVKSVDVSVKANLEGNLGLNGSLDKLEQFADGAKSLSDVKNVDVTVKANLEANLGFNGSLNELEQFAKGTKSLSDVESKDISVKANLDGNLGFNGNLDELESFAKGAKSLKGVESVDVFIKADLNGNLGSNGTIDKLSQFANGAKSLKDVDNVDVSIKANLDGNLGFNMSLDELESFAKGAKRLEGVKSSDVTVCANLNGNLGFNGSLDNLVKFAEGAKELNGVNSADVNVKANLDANLGSNMSLDKLEQFADGAKTLKGIESVSVSIKANLDSNLGFNMSLDELEQFAKGAKSLKGVDNVNVSVSANLEGNLGFNGSLDKLEEFANGAESLSGVKSVDVSIKANLDSNLGFNESLNELSKFAKNAKELDGVNSVDVSVKANLDANLGMNGSLDKLTQFAEGAKKLSNIDNISVTVEANLNGSLGTGVMLGQLPSFIESAKELSDISSSNVTVNANTTGNATYDSIARLEEFNSIATAMSALSDVTVTVNANVDSSNINSAITLLTNVSSSGVFKDYNATVTVSAKVSAIDDTVVQNYKVPSKNGKVKYDVDSSAVDSWSAPTKDGVVNYSASVEALTESQKNKTGTITYKVKIDGFGGAAGTANANGSASGHAFSRGNWGIKGNGVALGGELGQELVVRDGRFFTIGDNGAEFFRYKKNDIVFNAAQTESLFKYGGIKGANPRGKMLATGTAFAEGNAYITGGGSFYGSSSTTTKKETTTTTTTTTTSSSTSSNSGNNKNSVTGKTYKKSNKSTSKEEDKFEETLDWIETAIDRIKRAIDKLDQKANNIYKSWSTRNSALVDEIGKIRDEIDLQQRAYDKYIDAANGVGLSESYATKVRNGEINIETITDENLAEKIKDYQDFYEKALDCKDAIEELKETEASLYAQRVENVSIQYDGILGVVEHEKNMIEQYIAQSEANAMLVSSNYYKALSKNERENLSELEAQRDAMLAEFNAAMDSGTIENGSEAYYDMVSSIDEVTLAIAQSNTQLKEYEQTLQQLSWESFDLLHERISSVNEEAEFLIDLMSNKKLFDDKGQLTEEGSATMGLHGQNYNALMYQADLVAEEAARLKKELESDPYDTELEERYREMIALQQEYILAAEDEKEAIRDLVEEGIELEISALEELIEKKNEELSAEKDLYEYSKKVKEQTSEIASLEKQMAAYSGDDSEEAKQKIQQIKVDLEAAREELAETEQDKVIEGTEKLLDNLMLEYQETLNTRLDNIDVLIEQVVSEINADASIIGDTLREVTDSVGYTLSDSMKTIWDNSTTSTTNVITTYGDKFISAQTTTNAALNNINANLQNMIAQLNKEAGSNTKTASTSSAAKPKSSTTSTSTKKKTAKKSSGDGTPKVGDKVKYVSGQYYYDSQGVTPLGSHNKGEYVYITNINKKKWATHPYHISIGNKLGKGDLGWLKLNQISGYATGKKDFLDDEIAWTQENGSEIIVRPSDGAILTKIKSGDSVLNSAASGNIWNMANNPTEFIRNNLSLDSSSVPNNSNVHSSYIQNFENITFAMPNVKNYDEMLAAMQKDPKFEKLLLAMTIDQIVGKSSLAKGKALR